MRTQLLLFVALVLGASFAQAEIQLHKIDESKPVYIKQVCAITGFSSVSEVVFNSKVMDEQRDGLLIVGMGNVNLSIDDDDDYVVCGTISYQKK
jgi:hypothetical protein